jgi:RNA polymerase sigma factor (sigma-70 family)
MVLLPETRLSLIANLVDPANEAAWKEFLRIYESAVLRYCQSRGLGLEDALEVVQNVCVAVHQSASTWEPTGRSGSFRTWLFETARRMCLASLRQRNREFKVAMQASIDKESLQASPLEEFEEAEWERWAFYWACCQVQSSTQPQTWRAFWLTAVEGKSSELVAADLSMSLGAVYAAKCRILSRIRAVVAKLSRGEYRADT